jgi:hypothetical protein
MSQVSLAKGIPNQSFLKQTRFSNSLASKNKSKKISQATPQKNTKIQLNMSKTNPVTFFANMFVTWWDCG